MRPKIICHMVMSVDGRLLPRRWTPPADGDAESLLAHYERVAERFQADGWIVGRKSMEYYARGGRRIGEATNTTLRETFVADRRERPIGVAIDPQGKLHYGQDNTDGYHFVTVLGDQVTDAYLAELRAVGVSYLFAGTGGVDLTSAMNTLGDAFGVKKILLEGGGITNGAFLKEGLIDEISLLVFPGIDGLAGIPSIFESTGAANEQPAAGQALRFLNAEVLDSGMVWLRYAVERKTNL